MLTIGSAIGNGAGALISGPLLDLDGMLGLAGWQWIFLITGAIPVIGGIVILRYMRDGIDDATFLTDAAKADLARPIDSGEKKKHGFADVLKAIGDPKVLSQGFGYLTLLTALSAIISWPPPLGQTLPPK